MSVSFSSNTASMTSGLAASSASSRSVLRSYVTSVCPLNAITFRAGDENTGCRSPEKNTAYAERVSSPRTGRPLKCLEILMIIYIVFYFITQG